MGSRLSDFFFMLRIRFEFKPVDVWIGAYVDTTMKATYVCPLPMCRFRVSQHSFTTYLYPYEFKGLMKPLKIYITMFKNGLYDAECPYYNIGSYQREHLKDVFNDIKEELKWEAEDIRIFAEDPEEREFSKYKMRLLKILDVDKVESIKRSQQFIPLE